MKKTLFLMLFSLLIVAMSAISIIPAGTVSQDFTIGTSATATLPSDWKADKNSTARLVGSYSAAVTATNYYAGNSMSGSASNGIYNYGAGVADTATDRAVGWVSSGSATKSGNLYVMLTNTGSTTIPSFTVSYNVEKYRTGINTSGFSIQMYYSTNGSSWTSAGSDFLTSYAADASTAGYTAAPGVTTNVDGKTLNVTVAASGVIYLAWNYSVTSGTDTSNAQALGIDDVVIVAGVSGSTPTLSATPGTVSGFGYVQGSTTSTSQSYILSGTNLTGAPGNITVSGSTNYEVSTDNSTFAGSVNVSYGTATLGNTNIYVRLKLGLSTGTYNSETISNSGGGATTVNVSCSGTVTAPVYGHVPIALNNTVNQNFTIGTTASADLPDGWKVDKNTAVRSLVAFDSAATKTDYASTSPSSNGIYNFGSTSDTSDRSVGGLSSADNSKSVNVYVKLQNTGASTIPSWKISYDVEKYRNGTNSAGFSIQMYYSPDGSVWTSAGSDFLSSFPADGNNNGFNPTPGSSTSITNKALPIPILSSGNLYLAWNYSVTSGTTTSNAQALGIDNVSILASSDPVAATPSFNPPAGTYTSAQNVTISCETSGATIRYTTNGNDPTESSTLFSAGTPINLTDDAVIKAKAWATDYLPSLVATASYVIDIPVPAIEVSPNSLSGFTYVYGSGPSNEQSFGLSGSNLSANLTVAVTSNYEISSTSDGTFGSSLSFTPASGSVSATVYVRQVAGLAIGTSYNGTITCASTGAPEKTVALSGTVTSPPAPIAPLATAATNVTSNGFTANWGSVNGATGYYLDVYTKTAGTYATDLFFSEYIEGLSNNKAIEIYNGTGATVDLSDYTVYTYSNGASTPLYTLALAGTLNHGDVYVIANSNANHAIQGVADTFSNITWYDGDDALSLYKESTTSYVDIFGRIGEDPGTYWISGSLRTAEQTLVRKDSVTAGVTSNPSSGFPTLGTEWNTFAQDTVSYLGSHTMSGASQSVPVTGYINLDVSNNLNYDVQGLNPSTTYYYVVRAYDAYSQTSPNSNEITVTTTTAPVYDYPNDSAVTITGGTVTLTVGNANNSSNQTVIAVGNSNFTTSYYNVFTLIGAGPWTLTFNTTAPWGAYHRGGTWHSVQGSGSQIVMSITANKDLELPVVLGDQNPTLPIELSSFTATISAQNFVNLMWITQSETGVSGFYIYRGTVEDANQAELISPMISATNTSVTHTYLFTDNQLYNDGVYYYWLQNVDFDGTNSFHGPVVVNYSTGTGGPGTPVIPEVTELKGIFPNPFNPTAQISYSLKDAASVSIKVYNSRGQIVRSFDNAPGTVGNHRIVWDGRDFRGSSCSTGVYFVRMFAGKEVFTQKAVLVK